MWDISHDMKSNPVKAFAFGTQRVTVSLFGFTSVTSSKAALKKSKKSKS